MRRSRKLGIALVFTVVASATIGVSSSSACETSSVRTVVGVRPHSVHAWVRLSAQLDGPRDVYRGAVASSDENHPVPAIPSPSSH